MTRRNPSPWALPPGAEPSERPAPDRASPAPETTPRAYDRAHPRRGGQNANAHLRTFADKAAAVAAHERALKRMLEIGQEEGVRVLAFVFSDVSGEPKDPVNSGLAKGCFRTDTVAAAQHLSGDPDVVRTYAIDAMTAIFGAPAPAGQKPGSDPIGEPEGSA
ncbi:MAG: hypothetical protein ABL308_12830 [Oceanicaulis sp.]